MKYLLFILLTFLIVPINAQWVSFDLDEVGNYTFKQQVNPFIKSISVSTTKHFHKPVNINNRLGLGFAYSYGINISGEDDVSNLFGGFPNFAGSLVISDNLLLKGNFGIFNSGKNIVQSFAYGFGLNLTNKESNNWKTSVLFSKLQGPNDIKIKSIDGNIIYDLMISKLKMFAGVGFNTYNAKILINCETIPNTIKGNVNHLLFGTFINKGRFNITPLIQLNSDVIVVSLEFSGAVK